MLVETESRPLLDDRRPGGFGYQRNAAARLGRGGLDAKDVAHIFSSLADRVDMSRDTQSIAPLPRNWRTHVPVANRNSTFAPTFRYHRFGSGPVVASRP